MSGSPIISVIVPVYNVERYLRKCVDSIVNQTYSELEIILIDDGSTDRCGEICDELAEKDKRIKVIHQSNKGLSGARNAGMTIATGEYVTFVDSDDYIERNIYQRMLTTIIEEKADICMCGSLTVTESGEIIRTEIFKDRKIYQGGDLIEKIVLPLKTAVWNKLFRKDIIKNDLFPFNKVHGEDLIFLLQIIESSTKIVTVSEVGYYYVKHPNSITTAGFNVKDFDEVYCKDKAYEIMKLKFPDNSGKAFVWCFRARLNLLRKLMSQTGESFTQKEEEYKKWLKQYFKMVSRYISLKTKVEYLLSCYFPSIYRKIFLVLVRRKK